MLAANVSSQSPENAVLQGSRSHLSGEVFSFYLIRGAIAATLAAFVFGAARERLRSMDPSDPVLLLVTLVAAGFTLRAVTMITLGLRDLVELLVAPRCRLFLEQDALRFENGKKQVAVKREWLLGFVEQPKTRATRACIWLMWGRGEQLHYTALPAYLARSQGALSETLMRWQGESPQNLERGPLPSQLEARPERIQLLQYIPWFLVLLAAVFAFTAPRIAMVDSSYHAFAYHAFDWAVQAGAPLLTLAVAAGVLWLQYRKNIYPYRHSALRATPSKLWLRTRKGKMLEVPWGSVTEIGSRRSVSWSLILGYKESRYLYVDTSQTAPVRYLANRFTPPLPVTSFLLRHMQKKNQQSP